MKINKWENYVLYGGEMPTLELPLVQEVKQ